MTPLQFKQIVEETLSKFNTRLDDITMMFKKDKNPKLTIQDISTYMQSCSHITNVGDHRIGTADLKDLIKEHDFACKPHKNKYRFRSELDIEAYGIGNGDAEIDRVQLRATWHELRLPNTKLFELQSKDYAKIELRKAIVAHLNLKPLDSRISIDCKIIELWLAGSIDFNTLCTISNASCKL
jgi:hypothetical protein